MLKGIIIYSAIVTIFYLFEWVDEDWGEFVVIGPIGWLFWLGAYVIGFYRKRFSPIGRINYKYKKGKITYEEAVEQFKELRKKHKKTIDN